MFTLFKDLESLELILSSDNNMMHVFCVKQSQKTAHNILSNVTGQWVVCVLT